MPWKTRGNGAIAIAFHDSMALDAALDRSRAFVEQHAQRAAGTSPGVVVTDRALPSWVYDAAVTRVVERDELPLEHARAWGGRGVIGASAAIAWPAARATWERIAYRADAMRPRDVSARLLRDVETRFPSLFDTYDTVEDDVVCVPTSPCPVLWGLRGESPDDLARAAATLGPDKPARETLFLTNQGTDDHLRDGTTADARAYASLRVRGRVRRAPIERGGHVFLEIEDAHGVLRAAAYAPTRSFRGLVQRLAEGDDVTLCGGIHDGPDARPTLGIEKMRIHKTAPRNAGNPWCPACGRTMKSAGQGAGYRCRGCSTRAPAPRTRDADVHAGWHEVPASARRHLAMPLKRMQAGQGSSPAQ